MAHRWPGGIDRAALLRTFILTIIILKKYPEKLSNEVETRNSLKLTLNEWSMESEPKIAAPMHTSWKTAPKNRPYLSTKSKVVSSTSIMAAWRTRRNPSVDSNEVPGTPKKLKKTEREDHVPPCLMTEQPLRHLYVIEFNNCSIGSSTIINKAFSRRPVRTPPNSTQPLGHVIHHYF